MSGFFFWFLQHSLNYVILCSTKEINSYRVGTTWDELKLQNFGDTNGIFILGEIAFVYNVYWGHYCNKL